jgi:hypothetical protein
MIFEPWHVYAYNRCPILLFKKIDSTPPFAKALRANMLTITSSFIADHITTMRTITANWDKSWASIEHNYPDQRKEQLAGGGLKHLLEYLKWLTNMKKSVSYSPKIVGSEYMEQLDTDITVKVPLDLIMHNNTLITFGVTGGGRRENPYFSPYSMAQNWATMVWTSDHFMLDVVSHRERISKIRMKQSASFKVCLTQALKGIKSHLEQEVIVGRKALTCKSCNQCEGRFYWHASRT